jgi:hypothetical protein
MYKYKYPRSNNGADDDVIKVYNELKDKIKIANVHDLPEIIIQTMLIVEKYTNGSAIDKKELVIQVVVKTIDDSDVFGNYEDIVLPMIPILIDKFISIDNGHINFNNVSGNCCC